VPEHGIARRKASLQGEQGKVVRTMYARTGNTNDMLEEVLRRMMKGDTVVQELKLPKMD